MIETFFIVTATSIGAPDDAKNDRIKDYTPRGQQMILHRADWSDYWDKLPKEPRERCYPVYRFDNPVKALKTAQYYKASPWYHRVDVDSIKVIQMTVRTTYNEDDVTEVVKEAIK